MEGFEEIKLYGRGGQGIVTAGKLICLAAVKKGFYAQSIPSFGPERRGGLSQCSLRMGDEPILLKCGVVKPDIVCVFDPTIWHFINVTAGVKNGGTLIFNSKKSPEGIGEELSKGVWNYRMEPGNYNIFSVDASAITMKILGRTITNTAMMGAFSKATEVVDIETIKDIIGDKFKDVGNVEAAQEAYRELKGAGVRYGP